MFIILNLFLAILLSNFSNKSNKTKQRQTAINVREANSKKTAHLFYLKKVHEGRGSSCARFFIL